MVTILCLFAVLVLAVNAVTIPVSDPNWYFTEFNWGKGDGYAQAVNPGAYFKVGFTGTSVSLQFDFNGTSTTAFATVRYTIDGTPANQFQIPLANGNTIMNLSSTLAAGNHTLQVFVMNSLQEVDRWYGPECVTRVTGLVLSDGSATLPPALRPKRMLVYWDSIGEGVNVVPTGGGDLYANDGTETWAMALAFALQAEVSMAAFGRLGWTIAGNGNVPPVYTPGNDSNSSWNKIDSKHPRSFKGQLDYVVIGHGTNDGLWGRPGESVQASAFGYLVDLRAVLTNATSVVVVIPFGGFERQYLTEAYTMYQAKYNDAHTYLLDLGEPVSEGLTHFVGGGTFGSGDGIHPVVWRDGQLGAALALGIGRLLNL